jgi:methylase of polypeptide subunit release factors
MADQYDSSIQDHQKWIGYLQPEGLVFSAVALSEHGFIIDRSRQNESQALFEGHVQLDKEDEEVTWFGLRDFRQFLREYLKWPEEAIYGEVAARPLPADLVEPLADFTEEIRPTLAIRNPQRSLEDRAWDMLILEVPKGTDLDKLPEEKGHGWHASATKKMIRLLQGTSVPMGILTNQSEIRFIYAPGKENAGHLTFRVQDMRENQGKIILAAFTQLFDRAQLFDRKEGLRLLALLQRSREYQSKVSEQLAEQVLQSLYLLLRGFQDAHGKSGGLLLKEVLEKDPNSIYGGLLTILLRLVFLLYGEDRELLPTGALYYVNYSVHGLWEKLREDHDKHSDTMDLRYGAWARLIVLFRMIWQGCKHPELSMPAREGHLFDTNRYPFLEGRTHEKTEITDLPKITDGVIYRVLDKLLVLGGEKLSYRTLDVEEIGSVYQTIMGFKTVIVDGPSVALKGKRKGGGVPAAPIINLEELLTVPAKDRDKWLKEEAETDLSGEGLKKLKDAKSTTELLEALEKRLDKNAIPGVLSKGDLALQPTDERRKSGSHYTPRALTEPIVRKTLEPILKQLGENPTQDQILDLKIADLAVGSGAFLVEVARQLGEALKTSWAKHGNRPVIPPDETDELFAMRLVTQRCLYGVDRNPMAVDLAKLSLWLATLAKDHPFTFLDHSIRCGDTLVGLTRRQIECFTWSKEPTAPLLWEKEVRKRTQDALEERKRLMAEGDTYESPKLKKQKLEKADEMLNLVRFIGDAAVAAFFAEDKDKAREVKRAELAERIADYLGKGGIKSRPTDEVKALRGGQFPVTPFHWEVEYPEVFDHENPGFDGIVGNPPFAGKNTLLNGNREGYLDWIKSLHEDSHGNADLVSHFFRKAYYLLSNGGYFGLIGTKTIQEGDTRVTGLRSICNDGGIIYHARRRYKWPGAASVIVSVVNVAKSSFIGPCELDGRLVERITAYLFHAGGHDNPSVLKSNAHKSFIGSYVLGMGFTFDDTAPEGPANSIALMHQLVANSPYNAERIFPYIGGEELNESPTQTHHRFVINFADFPLRRADLKGSWKGASEPTRNEWKRSGVVPLDYPYPVAADWPELLAIVETKVKPERQLLGDNGDAKRRKNNWWLWGRYTPGLFAALAGKELTLVSSLVTQHLAFSFLPTTIVFSKNTAAFVFDTYAPAAALSCSIHEIWARFFSSSLGETMNYSPSDCFETFPFPVGFETDAALEAAGRKYYEFRAALMQDLWLGLTEIYNLFHSPDAEALARLEALYCKRAATPDWRTAESVPDDRSPKTLYVTPTAALAGVRRLRELHGAMDAAVLTAYGWTDLLPKCICEFLLDYENEDSESAAEESSGRKKKKPWRYRWPDEIRDEVLARLLKLNAERAAEEARVAAAVSASVPKTAKGPKKKKDKHEGTPSFL